MVAVHAEQFQEAGCDGVDLREMPQLSRPLEAIRMPGLDLCLLGHQARVAKLGVHDVPIDELSTDARKSPR